MKVSYSCTGNIKTLIQAHNRKLLNKTGEPEETTTKKCNCQRNRKHLCPLNGECQQFDVIYQATTDENPPMKYIGSTQDFKKRYSGHKQSFKREGKKNATTLSRHVWEKGLGKEPKIKWEILAKVPKYKLGTRSCNLCLTEKLLILKTRGTPATWTKGRSLHRNAAIRRKCASVRYDQGIGPWGAGRKKGWKKTGGRHTHQSASGAGRHRKFTALITRPLRTTEGPSKNV